MKIHILGSGTCIPSTRRGSSSYLVTEGSTKIMFDCGNGATWKLEKLGVSYLEIDYIFITHFHPDHTSDLIPFLFATKYPAVSPRTLPLHIFGPEGIHEFIASMKGVYNEWIEPECLVVEEINNTREITDVIRISATKTLHTENSVAYKLETEHKTIVYSGDTDYSDSLVDFATGADILIIECSLPDRLKRKGHLTPSEISMIANAAKPKKIVITHMYPVCDEENIYDQIRSGTECKVIIGEDLMEFNL